MKTKTLLVFLITIQVLPLALSGNTLCSQTLEVASRKNDNSGGRCLAAFPFASRSIVKAIAGAPDGTILTLWNHSSQQWEPDIEFNQANQTWTEPDRTTTKRHLEPGTAFFIQNPSQTEELHIKLTGLPPNDPTAIALTEGKLHAVSFAPPTLSPDFNHQPRMLECANGRYTPTSMGYPAHVGDRVYFWDEFDQDWVIHSRVKPANHNQVYWSGEGAGVSPTIPAGRGFFIVPAIDKYWIQSSRWIVCDDAAEVPRPVGRFSINRCVIEAKNLWSILQYVDYSSLLSLQP